VPWARYCGRVWDAAAALWRRVVRGHGGTAATARSAQRCAATRGAHAVPAAAPRRTAWRQALRRHRAALAKADTAARKTRYRKSALALQALFAAVAPRGWRQTAPLFARHASAWRTCDVAASLCGGSCAPPASALPRAARCARGRTLPALIACSARWQEVGGTAVGMLAWMRNAHAMAA